MVYNIPQTLMIIKEQLDDVTLIDGKDSDLLKQEKELKNILEKNGIDSFTKSLISSITSSQISSIEAMTFLLPSFIRSNQININDMSSIINNMYTSKIINNSDLNVLMGELKRTNLSYVTTQDSIGSLQQWLNNHYNYDYDYTVSKRNDEEYCFKISSEYEFDMNDVNVILKPLYDKNIIDTDDMEEIVFSLHAFNKTPGNLDKYNNKNMNVNLLDFSGVGYNGDRFLLTENNRTYELNDIDIKYVKQIPYFESYFTGDDNYDRVIAKLCASDYVQAIHTREMGSNKDNIDEALALNSLLINRTESNQWNYGTNDEGKSMIYQLIKGTIIDPKPNHRLQYSDFLPEGTKGSAAGYLNGKTFNTVEEAVIDSMNGVRNTDTLSYPYNDPFDTNTMISRGGNNFTRDNMTKEQVLADKNVEYTGTPYVKKDNSDSLFTTVIPKVLDGNGPAATDTPITNNNEITPETPTTSTPSTTTPNDTLTPSITSPNTSTPYSGGGGGYGGGYYGGGYSAPSNPVTPVVEPTPIVEPTPVVEPAPIVEPTPVVEPAPIVEPTPVVKPIPVEKPQIIENIIYTPVKEMSSIVTPIDPDINTELAIDDNAIIDIPINEEVEPIIESPIIEPVIEPVIEVVDPIIPIPTPTPVINNTNSGSSLGTAAIIGGLGALAAGGYIASKKIKENKEKEEVKEDEYINTSYDTIANDFPNTISLPKEGVTKEELQNEYYEEKY